MPSLCCWRDVYHGDKSHQNNPIVDRIARISVDNEDKLSNELTAGISLEKFAFASYATSTLKMSDSYKYEDKAQVGFAFDLRYDLNDNEPNSDSKKDIKNIEGGAKSICSSGTRTYAMTNFGLVDWAKGLDNSQNTFRDSAAVIKFTRVATLTLIDGELGLSFGTPLSFGPGVKYKSDQKTTITIEFLVPDEAKPKAVEPRKSAKDELKNKLERNDVVNLLNTAVEANTPNPNF